MKKIANAGSAVVIGTDTFRALNNFIKKGNYTSFVILCDEHTVQHCLPVLVVHCEALRSAELIELESGEMQKNLETCVQVWSALQDMQVDKNTLIVNLGGGVITDLGGFVASVYKRGLDFVNIPTTLLAMVDASVGGKNGVDLNTIKNQIGTITLPKLVVVNPVFLQTLDERQIRNGIAEIVKVAMIRDEVFFKKLSLFRSSRSFINEETIVRAVQLKQEVVKKDPYEQHLRKCLNFGHSIGHALESACLEEGRDVLHGEAIVAGMVMETYVAFCMKRCSKVTLRAVEKMALKYYAGIPLPDSIITRMKTHIRHDKKNVNGMCWFAIAAAPGQFGMMEMSDLTLIDKAAAHYTQLYNLT